MTSFTKPLPRSHPNKDISSEESNLNDSISTHFKRYKYYIPPIHSIYFYFKSICFEKKSRYVCKPLPPDVILMSFWQKHIFEPSLIQIIIKFFKGLGSFLAVKCIQIEPEKVLSAKNMCNFCRKFVVHRYKGMPSLQIHALYCIV